MSLSDQTRRLKMRVSNGWTKGALARRKSGHSCHVYSKGAEKFCLLGALVREALINSTIHTNIRKLVGHNISDFNDAKDTTLEDVLGLITAAGKL